METPERILDLALRQLAVALANAQDRGIDHGALVARLSTGASPSRDAELVEDALLAAGVLLTGADPHLALLAGVWGAAELWSVVEELAEELRHSP